MDTRHPDDLYPTRGEEEQLIERVEPTVYGKGEPKGPKSLSPDQAGDFGRDGFIIIPNAFSEAEVDIMRSEYQALAGRKELWEGEEFIAEPDSDELRTVFNPQKYSTFFESLSRDRRFLDPARQLLDSDVYIHHSRINIKRAMSGKSFPWHSDLETWHAEDGLPNMRVLTGWVMLTDNTFFNGPLFLIPGSHKTFVACKGMTPENNHEQSLRKQEYGVPSLGAINALTESTELAGAVGKAGTLVFHEGNIMHGSPDNISPDPRTNLFFVYNSVLNAPAERPFAAPNFRPDFLSNPDHTPLVPVDNAFETI